MYINKPYKINFILDVNNSILKAPNYSNVCRLTEKVILYNSRIVAGAALIIESSSYNRLNFISLSYFF